MRRALLRLAQALARELEAPAKPRRKLKTKPRAYTGPVRLDAGQPIFRQLRSIYGG